ncbi:MAG: molybdate ABC transporter substrate-binding protein [Acidobacteriota bacterium]
MWLRLVRLLAPMLVICFSFIGCEREGARLTVSAAADLTDAFAEIGQRFTAQTGMEVSFNFGSTGQLAQQIEQGAPVDLFAAASREYLDDLERKGRIVPGSRRHYGTGRLAIWTRLDRGLRIESLADLRQPGIKRIAIANPEHAPYGIAARESLIAAGLWEELSPRLVMGENVRQTLRYAESGDVDAALVALSLCHPQRQDPPRAQITLVPADAHRPLIQEMAIITGTSQPERARQFSELVLSEVGREILARYGFSVADAESRR